MQQVRDAQGLAPKKLHGPLRVAGDGKNGVEKEGVDDKNTFRETLCFHRLNKSKRSTEYGSIPHREGGLPIREKEMNY